MIACANIKFNIYIKYICCVQPRHDDFQVEASNQVSFGCKKVSFDSIQMHEVEVDDERKRLKEANSPEASLQRFLEMIDANGVILEEKVSRKRRRDFGLLESEACLAESSM